MKPGTNCADAPITCKGRPSWLLNQLGEGFTVLVFGDASEAAFLPGIDVLVKTIGAPGSGADLIDRDGLVAARYGATAGTTYLIRPDQHVAARWKRFDAQQIQAALARCLCH
jgi:3-(3-hydroxy-phenyl)propionate hydroxylase